MENFSNDGLTVVKKCFVRNFFLEKNKKSYNPKFQNIIYFIYYIIY